MATELLPLSGDEARAFHAAFSKRNEYIAAEEIDLLIGGEERVPLPGCPACASPGESVLWIVKDEWIAVHVKPCGHRFRTERPVGLRTSGDGWTSMEEWLP